jgi:hypothetical protein
LEFSRKGDMNSTAPAAAVDAAAVAAEDTLAGAIVVCFCGLICAGLMRPARVGFQFWRFSSPIGI